MGRSMLNISVQTYCLLVCGLCWLSQSYAVLETSKVNSQNILSALSKKVERVKRDVDASQKDSVNSGDSHSDFLQNIFAKYGKDGVLTFEGFEHLLENIGLSDLHIKDHTFEAHADWEKDLHEDHNHTAPRSPQGGTGCAGSGHSRAVRSVDEGHSRVVSHADDESHGKHEEEQKTGNHSSDCFSPVQLLKIHNLTETSVVTKNDFLSLCPTLIYQLDVHSCSSSSSNHHHHHHHSEADDNDHHHHHHKHHGNQTGSAGWKSPSYKVWGYAILACLVISAVGLICVCIIPIMHRVIYNHMLQFLVALAIGSLSGDALLHLIPHAMMPHGPHDEEEAHDHDRVVWLGLVAVGGIFLFFVIEQFVKISSERRHARREKRYLEASANSEAARLDTSLKNDITMQTSFAASAVSGAAGDTNQGSPTLKHSNKNGVGARLAEQGGAGPNASCEEMIMIVHTNKEIRMLSDTAHDDVHRHCDPTTREENKTVWTSTHDKDGHHHSHKVPSSVASVAWMVIVGDGFHNFADGLAIGSAFARSLTDGLSTSIAVLCHELPHELGDFAMLLNAGMTSKKALVYNCVSSILCLLGMVIGILVGNIEAASQWIFSAVAGLFLYVALVGMLPEMKSVRPKPGENPFFHFALQSCGMLMGAGIMLCIALYEDRISFDPV